jgi:type III pantothenate kinase
MLIAIDIGNSKIKVGIFEDYPKNNIKTISFDSDIKNIKNIPKSITEHIATLNKEINAIDCIVSSVVPSLNDEIILQINNELNLNPIFVNYSSIPEIKLDYEPESDLGADRIADCIAANYLYPKNLFKIVVDFGTATVFEVISKKGDFLGGSIFPGLEVASKALSDNASLLESIDLKNLSANNKVIGNSTAESLKSSLFWGYISLTEGIVSRIINELKVQRKDVFVVGTGGFANLIDNHTSIFDNIEPNLTLEGLRLIYKLKHDR